MATAGELLAGMAHELNNPLQAIRGIAELGQGTGGPGAKDWAVVLEQARRASKLVNDLVRFVRPPVRRLMPVDLNDVVRDGLDLIGFQFRADGIAIETELDPEVRPVQADANDLVQVLVNLLGNAHAVLHNGQTSRRKVTVRTWTQGDRVGATVHDSGPGVSEEVRERVFNPFFSTKDRGFGLGLSVARDILRGYGGDVVLDRVRDGASFTFWLPAVDQATAASPSAVAHPEAAKGETFKGRRIVVADDEDAIRGVLTRCLERDGAEVRTAAGGVMALELIRQQPPDAVLLDLRMPDLDGLGVYRRVRQVDPALAERIIFVTGDPSAMDPALGIPAERILTKPVELNVMRDAVRRVLAGA
jgi:two-component system NtrC family sensor kinase